MPTIEEKLEKSFQEIDTIIEAEILADDVEKQARKLNKLCIISANAADNIAVAKELLLNKQLESLKAILESSPDIGSVVAMKLLGGECAKYERYYVKADRQFSAINKNIEGIRTLISKYKSELENQVSV